ncbi:hypothetical protein BD289DRAFT_427531 [Coniella lustricola]|uniref:Uncharacterized protein n=1 Tax=Coniella lustricola TaxID=2025994 RepID=A0A2T3AFE0_9PEZI|nr:hypothetical protein BD289DRAFT_427531 [Coniella lustricola]
MQSRQTSQSSKAPSDLGKTADSCVVLLLCLCTLRCVALCCAVQDKYYPWRGVDAVQVAKVVRVADRLFGFPLFAQLVQLPFQHRDFAMVVSCGSDSFIHPFTDAYTMINIHMDAKHVTLCVQMQIDGNEAISSPTPRYLQPFRSSRRRIASTAKR